MVLRKVGTKISLLSVTGLSPSLVGLSSTIHLGGDFVTSPGPQLDQKPTSYNPCTATELAFNTVQVWAPPLSLAATQGISV